MARSSTTRRPSWSAGTLAVCAGTLALGVPPAAQAWEPTKPIQFVIPAGPGGGADQMARFIQGVVAKHKSRKAADHHDQQGRGGGGYRLPGGQEVGWRPTQHHHHPVEPVHHAACHRRALQLEGPDPGRDARARPVRPVGERRVALQDREGVHRGGEGCPRQGLQDGRHGLQAGGPDHHCGPGKAHRA